MKRSEWVFQRTAAELQEAASGKATYHEGRVDFWEHERDTAMQAIKDAGFDIREHQQTGGPRHEVVVDPTLSRRLSECEAKIAQHTAKTDDYSQWLAALKSAGEVTLSLDFNDWTFFFGLLGDDDE